MVHYLMRLVEGFGEFENYTYHLIDARDEQMVKYHYHHTMKDWGYHNADWGNKHSLDSWDSGHAKLDRISELNNMEYGVLREYITNWYKTADH